MDEGETMIRYKLKDVAFECDETKGKAKVITPEHTAEFGNAIEGMNAFFSQAFRPIELQLRRALADNGFNYWTGEPENDG